jgi:hypothetical protein
MIDHSQYIWDDKIVIFFCFSIKDAALGRTSKNWLARNQDNMSQSADIRELLFQWSSTIKIQLSVMV